ncbi:MAG: PKD domain-containing protein [Candidatus Auribacterota bacterium]|jgi:PKD repeat protein|nr:PKD domain-containing protein [Candidatus Auribacterota bacterium]
MFRSYLVAVRAVDDNAPERSSIATEELVISEGNHAPMAFTGGPYRQEIGLDVTLNASASYDPDAACGDSIIEYAWDINNNGSFDDPVDIKADTPLTILSWDKMSSWPVGVAQTIRLRLTDSLGLTKLANTTVTIYENQPVAVLSSNLEHAACNQVITFNGSASYHKYYPVRNLVTFKWDFDYDGDTPEWDCEGSLATVGILTHKYSQYGTYTVLLRVEDNNVPAKTSDALLTVYIDQGNQNPVPVISGLLQIPVGSSLLLDGAQSTDPNQACGDEIVGYDWDIDGDGDFDENISGKYINLAWDDYKFMVDYPAGHATGNPSNTIRLRVTDKLGGQATASVQLRIYDNDPVASFTATPQMAGCNQTLTFNASASYHQNPTKSIVTYRWDFDYNGTTPSWDAVGGASTHKQLTRTYNHYGQYTVLLEVQDNNDPAKTDSYTLLVDINNIVDNVPPVAVHGGPYVISQGDNLTLLGSNSYDNNSLCGDSIVLYEWDIDGDNVYNGPNDVTGATPTIPWSTLASLNLAIANPSTQTPTNPIGLRVTDSQGATSTARTVLRIYVNEPVAVAHADTINISCDENTVVLDAYSSYHRHPGHSIVSYDWDFQDDGIFDASGIEVSHEYFVYGTHTVRLRVTDDQGKTDEDTVAITLSFTNTAPIAHAGGPYTTSVFGGYPMPVILDGTRSRDPDAPCDNIVEYYWFTDGSGYIGGTQTLNYVNPNWQRGVTYVVKLKVKDSMGVWSSEATAQIIVQNSPPPALTLLAPNGGECLRGSTQIQFRVRDPEGEVVTVTAKLGGITVGSVVVDTDDTGDWTTATIALNTTSFTDGTTYKVVLEAADTGGGTSSVTSANNFTIDNTQPAAPTVSVPALGACYASLPATSASSTDNITVNPTITRIDSQDGCNWTSTFTATDACGNQSSPTVVTYKVSDATLAVTIGGVVEGGIYAPGKEVTYGHTSSSDCVNNISAIMFGEQWGWVEHPFASGDTVSVPGQYMLLVTVTNICGVDVVETLSFIINGAPIADAGGPYSGTEGVPVPLSGAGSYDPEGLELVSYVWDLDNDGEFDDAFTMETSVQYNVVGTYTVALRVTDSLGAWDVATAQVTIENTAPVVSAGSNQTVNEGDTVTFAGSFTDTGDESVTHTIHWSFGDGSTAEGTLSPTHVYGDNGTYTVTLTVTDDDGAVSSDTLTVVVNNVSPVLEVFPEQLLENEGEPVSFTATYSDAGVLDTHTATIDWGDQSVENRAVSGGTFSGSHTYLYKGTYTVTVTVRDDDGGEASESYNVTIGRIPINLSVEIESDRSATILFNGIPGKNYDIYYYEGDIVDYGDIGEWSLLETVYVSDRGICNDAGSPGADGQWGTSDDRPAPCEVPVRYYRVLESGSISSGEPWSSGQIGYYLSCVVVDGRNFIGKTGCSQTLNESLDCRFLRIGKDVMMLHDGINIDYPKNQTLEKAFVLDYAGYLFWMDSSAESVVNEDPLFSGAGFMMTLPPGIGPKHVPMAGIIETKDEILIDLEAGVYTLVSWPYANESSLRDSGLIESGFKGDTRARTADLVYFWNAETQGYDLPVFYFTGTGEWRNYDQSPTTKTLKPGESFLIKLQPSSPCTQWRVQRPYAKPTYTLEP